MEEKDEELQTTLVATRWSIWAGGDQGRLLATPWHICANFATCSLEPLTILNPHFVAGEHGLFGAISLKTFRHFSFSISRLGVCPIMHINRDLAVEGKKHIL